MSHKEFQGATEKSLYTYRRNPIHLQAFMILKQQDDDRYTPIGDYTVLDDAENPSLSEKKVMNLVSAMNGKHKLIDLGQETQSQLFFKPIPRLDESEKSKVIFYQFCPDAGLSKENAILTIEEDLER